MNYLHRLLAVASAAFFIACAPAAAQWQVPNHSVPVGKGSGATGFGSLGPCTSGFMFVWTGVSSDPTCRALITSDIPISGLSTNVAATGTQGIENSPFFIFNSLPTAAPPYIAGLRSQFDVSYTTLNPGTSYPALWGFVNVQAGVQDSYYGILGNVHNASTGGEHVGGYLQAHRTADGQTWAAVTEVKDLTGNADPTKALVAIEADIFANGTDSNKQRIGIEIVAGKGVTPGATNTVTYGFRTVPWNSDPTEAIFTNGYSAEGAYTDILNFHTATASHSAMWLADGHKILFDTVGTRSLSYSGTVLSYQISGSPVFSVVDSGDVSAAASITANGNVKAVNRILTGTQTPNLTSCGTSPSVSGTDTAGVVTVGTGSPTSCVVNFSALYNSAPYCVVSWQANLATMNYTVSTAGIVIAQTATSSNKINYVCVGQSGG